MCEVSVYCLSKKHMLLEGVNCYKKGDDNVINPITDYKSTINNFVIQLIKNHTLKKSSKLLELASV